MSWIVGYFSLSSICKHRFSWLSTLLSYISVYQPSKINTHAIEYSQTIFCNLINIFLIKTMILIFISFRIPDETVKKKKKWPFLADCPMNSALRHWRQFWLCFDVFTNLLLYSFDGSQNIRLWSHFSLAVFSTQSDMYTNIQRTEECF